MVFMDNIAVTGQCIGDDTYGFERHFTAKEKSDMVESHSDWAWQDWAIRAWEDMYYDPFDEGPRVVDLMYKAIRSYAGPLSPKHHIGDMQLVLI